MIVLEDMLRDRGSRYAASAGPVSSKAEIDAFLSSLRNRRKFGKATHHSWAAVLATGGPLKNDDGEAGAGAVILKMLEREAVVDRIVVVTRWYGAFIWAATASPISSPAPARRCKLCVTLRPPAPDTHSHSCIKDLAHRSVLARFFPRVRRARASEERT